MVTDSEWSSAWRQVHSLKYQYQYKYFSFKYKYKYQVVLQHCKHNLTKDVAGAWVKLEPRRGRGGAACASG